MAMNINDSNNSYNTNYINNSNNLYNTVNNFFPN